MMDSYCFSWMLQWKSPNLPFEVKGVHIFQTFWKPDFCTPFLFLELETSNIGYLLIFWFPVTVQSFINIGQHWYKTFYKGPPLEFLVDYKIKKHPFRIRLFPNKIPFVIYISIATYYTSFFPSCHHHLIPNLR